MLKLFGLSVIVSDATLTRFTIVELPIHMVTLLTLAVLMSISSHYLHDHQEIKRVLRYQVALKW